MDCKNREYTVYMLAKCTKRLYAEDLFYGGNLFFNFPINWIKMANDGNVGQGDYLEGVYTNVVTDYTKALRSDSESLMCGDIEYLRSISLVSNWPSLSFYSISELRDHDVDGDSLVFHMGKSYLNSFIHDETFHNMYKKPLSERLSMVIIQQTGEFLQRLRTYFVNHGLIEDRDFYLGAVTYRKDDAPFLYIDPPYELYSKNNIFRDQNEFRVVLNPNNPKVVEMLGDYNKINIGPISDIAILRAAFYDPSTIYINDNHVKIENANIACGTYVLNEMTFNWLCDVIMPLAYHTTTVVLDGQVLPVSALWRELSNILYSKYRIVITHEKYIDGQNDKYHLYFNADDYHTILVNEDRDTYYYERHSKYKSREMTGMRGGCPSGLVELLFFQSVES